MPLTAILLLGLITARTEPLDDAYPVANLDLRVNGTSSSDALVVGQLGRLGLFAATGSNGALGLWRSDGTAVGTFEIASLGTRPYLLGTAGTHAFLHVSDGVTGYLLATDGTTAGTTRLLDAPIVRFLGALDDGSAALSVSRGGSADRLWRSDGTRAGTRRLGGVVPRELAVSIGHRVVFSGFTPRRGVEMWSTDGTALGTVVLADISPGPATSFLFNLAAVGDGHALFVQADTQGRVLWSTDGTQAGTHAVALPPSAESLPVVLGGTDLGFALFAYDGLWRTDGTAAGTSRLLPAPARSGAWLASRSSSDVPGDGVVTLGDVAYFGFADDTHGHELWRSDGTVSGTRLVRDICPGRCDGLDDLVLAGSSLLMLAGREGDSDLWASDGTRLGTRLVREICAQGCPSPPKRLVVDPTHPGRAYFSVAGRQEGRQLWRTDGTRTSTVRLDGPDLEIQFPTEPTLLTAGDGVLFAATDLSHGRELWSSGGSLATTHLLADLDARAVGIGSDPHGFVAVGSGIVFLASDARGLGLWSTNGNPGPGERLAPVATDATGTQSRLACSSAHAIFTSSGFDGFVNEVWGTDGTLAGTSRLWAGGHSPEVTCFGNDEALILGDGLWHSDGSAAGTSRVTDLAGAAPWRGVAIGDRVVLATHSYEVPPEQQGVWISDGTSPGTYRLSSEPLDPLCLTSLGLDALFVSATASAPRQLWSANESSAAPLAALGDITPDDLGCADLSISPNGSGQAYLTLDRHTLSLADGTHVETVRDFGADAMIAGIRSTLWGALVFVRQGFGSTTVWRTDGTAAGTHSFVALDGFEEPGPSAEIPGLTIVALQRTGGLLATDGAQRIELPGPSRIVALRSAGDRIVMATEDGTWTTDGTASGTVRRHESPRGLGSRGELALLGSRVVFAGATLEEGWEPWAFDLP